MNNEEDESELGNKVENKVAVQSAIVSADGSEIFVGTDIMNSSVPASFEKLDGSSNYIDWKYGMEIHLINCDLWDYVNGTKVDTKQESRALAAIVSGVKTHIYTEIRELKTGKNVWERLQKVYEPKGFSRVAALIEQLVMIRFSDCKCMSEYLKRKVLLAQQLKAIDNEIKDGVLAALIFVSLPDCYKPLIMALENCGADLTTDLVKERLLAESIRYEEVEKETALVTKAKQFKKSKNFRGKCFNCDKIGHRSVDCRAPKKFVKEKHETGLMSKVSTTTALGVGKFNINDWYVDSGATVHLTGRKDWLTNVKPLNKVGKVVTASGEHFNVTEIGDTIVLLDINGKCVKTPIRDVRYAEGLKFNLISCKQLGKKGIMTTIIDDRSCEILVRDTRKIIAYATSSGDDLYKLKRFEESNMKACFSSSINTDYSIWHRRLGHLNVDCMKKLRDGLAKGIAFKNQECEGICVGCVKGKQHRNPFPKGKARRATNKLGLIHMDLCGPMQEASISGKRYVLTFTDDFTRKTFVYFLMNKDETFGKFKEFKVRVEKETLLKIQAIRSDNGKEFVNYNFQNFLKVHGIQHQ